MQCRLRDSGTEVAPGSHDIIVMHARRRPQAVHTRCATAGRLRDPDRARSTKNCGVGTQHFQAFSSRRTNTDSDRRASTSTAVPDPGSLPARDARRPASRAHSPRAFLERCGVRGCLDSGRRTATRSVAARADSCSRANAGGSLRGKSSGSAVASDAIPRGSIQGRGKWRRNQLDFFAGAMAAWPRL